MARPRNRAGRSVSTCEANACNTRLLQHSASAVTARLPVISVRSALLPWKTIERGLGGFSHVKRRWAPAPAAARGGGRRRGRRA